MTKIGQSVTIPNTSPYPFINNEGEIKLGLAITITEDGATDDIFSDMTANEAMLVIDSETGKTISGEKKFKIESLNEKNRSVSEEVFENLANVRKSVTLSKAFKSLKNNDFTHYGELNIDTDAENMLHKTIAKVASTSASMKDKIRENTSEDLQGALESYAFKKHLMITGNAGEGKTFMVDQHINTKGYECVEEIAHTGIEAIDLIGHYIKKPDGSFIWKDGSFSEAFRKAQHGPVVYFIDEMLRMPARELNVLVGSLTPNSLGNLTLKTMRFVDEVDGIANSEKIVVPQENLWVVATSNQGAGYQSARIDEALKDRFRMFYQEMSPAQVYTIIEMKYKRLGGSTPAVKAIVSLIEKTGEIKESGNIPRAFTIRHLSEAIDTADSLTHVKKRLFELIPNIVSIDSDGRFNKEQVEIVKSLIKKTV